MYFQMEKDMVECWKTHLILVEGRAKCNCQPLKHYQIMRGGSCMKKVSLAQMRKMDIFEEVESPKLVYHMTSRENAQSIIHDGRVRCFDDYVTWFFTELWHVPVYIYATDADHGRQHSDKWGYPTIDPPLNHADTVVLKLSCRKEPLAWYREVINSSKERYRWMTDLHDQFYSYFNNVRICHYGDLRFTGVLEVIELTDIDKMPQPKEIEEIKKIQEKMMEHAS